VGRPSALGNPFVVGHDGSRQEVIAKYRRWLWARLQEPDSPQEHELRRLLARAAAGELELLCWCHPLPCHAEVVRGVLVWLAGEEEGRAHASSGRNRPEKPTIKWSLLSLQPTVVSDARLRGQANRLCLVNL